MGNIENRDAEGPGMVEMRAKVRYMLGSGTASSRTRGVEAHALEWLQGKSFMIEVHSTCHGLTYMTFDSTAMYSAPKCSRTPKKGWLYAKAVQRVYSNVGVE